MYVITSSRASSSLPEPDLGARVAVSSTPLGFARLLPHRDRPDRVPLAFPPTRTTPRVHFLLPPNHPPNHPFFAALLASCFATNSVYSFPRIRRAAFAARSISSWRFFSSGR